MPPTHKVARTILARLYHLRNEIDGLRDHATSSNETYRAIEALDLADASLEAASRHLERAVDEMS